MIVGRVEFVHIFCPAICSSYAESHEKLLAVMHDGKAPVQTDGELLSGHFLAEVFFLGAVLPIKPSSYTMPRVEH